MKIAITVGHSLLKNGCYTSADGTKFGGCNEYKWCKAFSKQLSNALRKKGHTVDVIICPKKKFISSKEEKPYKLNIINSGNYDLVMELHLNAASELANGAEVLYKSEKGRRIAIKIQTQLATIFKDRGVIKRDDLYILNGTKPTAVLLETFFCTNKSDYKKAKGIVNRRKIAKAIANAF